MVFSPLFSSSASSLASSSSRSFSTTLPSTYRRAHWITDRSALKEVPQQSSSDNKGFLKGFKDKIFEPSTTSSAANHGEPVDLLDQVEESTQRETDAEEINRRRAELEREDQEKKKKAEKEAKLNESRRQSTPTPNNWKPPKQVDTNKAMETAVKNRRIPIEVSHHPNVPLERSKQAGSRRPDW